MLLGGDALASVPLAAFSSPFGILVYPVRVPTVDARGGSRVVDGVGGAMSFSATQPPINSYPPTILGANMRQGTEDYRGVSYWQTLQDARSYIDEITAITVTRLDGRTLVPGDLTVTPSDNAFVVPPWATADVRYPGGPSVVNWWQSVGPDIAASGNVGYLLTIEFITTTGEELAFDAVQIVTSVLG